MKLAIDKKHKPGMCNRTNCYNKISHWLMLKGGVVGLCEKHWRDEPKALRSTNEVTITIRGRKARR